MTSQFIEALIYISCKLQENAIYSIWGIPVQAQYVPFVHLLMDLFMGQSIIPDIIGLLAGHCYYFLKSVCPRTYGKDYLPTPKFLYFLLGIYNRIRWFKDEGHPVQQQAHHPHPFGGHGVQVG